MDGAMGFWAALDEAFPDTKHQRCWMHKSGNVLNKFPKSSQPKAKGMLHDIGPVGKRRLSQKRYIFYQ